MLSNHIDQRSCGGQPGNHRAKGGRGNPCLRRICGYKGGLGALLGEQHVRQIGKEKLETLLEDYQHLDEATLELACFTDDNQGDVTLHPGSDHGVMLETLARHGREFRRD